ncbi:MAG TPA: hypothetical protein VKB51_19310 [bacterium]|nr:hypothetical protein [bacterium]
MPRTYRRPLRSALVPALLAVLLAATLLSGCGRDSGPAIMGHYTDDYGGTHEITQTTWTDSGPGYKDVFHIVDYDNQQLYILAQNDAANAYNASLYSRFTWTYSGSGLYYCQDPYDAASADAARLAAPPDSSNPAASGCGASSSYPWTRLIPQ